MKKILSFVLMLSITLLIFASCAQDNTKIRIGYMSGPTGMGMAELIHSNGGVEGNEKYSFDKYDNSSLALADIASGKIDLACLPTNDAANYYNKNGGITVLAVNTLSSLFILTDKNTTISSFEELEGKTVYTCKNGTPRMVLEAFINKLELKNVTVSYELDGKDIGTPKQLGEQLVAGNIDIALVPEPIITSSLLTIAKNGNSDIEYSVDLPISNVWSEAYGTDLTMGCIVSSTEFAEAHKGRINAFLDEYKSSIDFIANSQNLDNSAEYIVECGVMAAPAAAKKALSNLSGAIAFMDGKEMKAALTEFYLALNIQNPDDEFYYGS